MRRSALTCVVGISLGSVLLAASACATSPDEQQGAVVLADTPKGEVEEGGVKLPPASQAEDSGKTKDASPAPVDAAKPDPDAASSSSSSSSSGAPAAACDVTNPIKEAYYLAQIAAGSAKGLCPCAATECCYTLVCVAR